VLNIAGLIKVLIFVHGFFFPSFCDIDLGFINLIVFGLIFVCVWLLKFIDSNCLKQQQSIVLMEQVL
jgi:hypothetical protein